ncbi:MAG: hypothetical protein KA117_09485 [Verrucomicrobia bacterium]|nr:hypothetical protein [Verrucomicrobiota bacterium]OQC26561.1 MAG: hypothetical protein BWX68_00683 [Verrucomicrobia bacterium ADurb.Bin063]MBP8015511.1 hypothetical protein [Verrucomicrobiota bacterium]HNW08789.1 hypothetical protein [Verrucomicrobiota bacterium]HNZ76389.1 hypothetical protein [Verrucomicrobiota bacterium]
MRNACLLRVILLAGCLANDPCPLSALPLQRADVPAAPAWVLHVDCDKLRPSAMGQYLLEGMEKPEIRARLGAFWAALQLDPRKHLRGLTLYGRADAPADGTLLVYGDFQAGQLERAARAAKDHLTTPYQKHRIHQWLDTSGNRNPSADQRVYGAMHHQRVIILSRQETNVAHALDVLDCTVRSLRESGQCAQLGNQAGSVFLQAAATKVEPLPVHPATIILRLARAARLEMSEASDRFTATLSLEADGNATATQILSAGQALLKLVKLQPNAASAMRLISAINLKQQGSEVEATLAASASEIIALLKNEGSQPESKQPKPSSPNN